MRLTRRHEAFGLTRGKIYKMSQERQRISFLIVVVFLAVFGIIILAEVLFMEESRAEFFYEQEDTSSSSERDFWETPKPLEVRSSPEIGDKFKISSKMQLSLKKHQENMERLIRNISQSISKKKYPSKRPAFSTKSEDPPEELPAFDFDLINHQGFDAQWQPVKGIKHKFYIYSSFYDVRDQSHPVIRIIGVTKTKRSEKVACKLYFNNGAGNVTSSKVHANIFIIRENWNLKYSACFVTCQLDTKSGTSRVPDSVSVIALSGNELVTNQLPVNNAVYGGTRIINTTDIGVCVKPIHFHYNKTMELLEFIELNKILGVSRFTFYNHTTSEEVGCILNHYEQEEKVVNLLPWNLKVDSQTEIRTEGLFAALNDCLYRNMNAFQYLMLIDFDEFIVPHQNRTLPEMLQHLNSRKVLQKNGQRLKYPKTISSYSFQNGFFYLQFPDDEDSTTGLRVLRKTRRKSKFNPQKQRSKYICVPRLVKEAGNHFIWEFQSGHNVNVPTDVGFLHHYRVCEFGGDDCVQAANEVDRTMHNYSDELQHNVQKIIRKLSSKCGLDRLVSPPQNGHNTVAIH